MSLSEEEEEEEEMDSSSSFRLVEVKFGQGEPRLAWLPLKGGAVAAEEGRGRRSQLAAEKEMDEGKEVEREREIFLLSAAVLRPAPEER